LVNRVVAPDRLDAEVNELVETLLAKNAQTVTTTKYFIDKAADLDMWSSLFFEGAPQRRTNRSGIVDFADRDLRAKTQPEPRFLARPRNIYYGLARSYGPSEAGFVA
jgi:hypothetical protein